MGKLWIRILKYRRASLTTSAALARALATLCLLAISTTAFATDDAHGGVDLVYRSADTLGAGLCLSALRFDQADFAYGPSARLGIGIGGASFSAGITACVPEFYGMDLHVSAVRT